MKALRFDHFGDPSVLEFADIERPTPRAGEVLVQIHAGSINPSDVRNVAGKMHATTLPRTPGRDFAGVVVAGPPEIVGAEVWGAGGDIGITRDGAHAEFIALPEDGVSRKPPHLAFDEAAAVGVNFVTAWAGLNDAAHLGAGETVFVTGVSGGVGTAVVQLARWMGARSIGFDRIRREMPAPLLPDVFLAEGEDIVAAVLRETGGRGVDVVYDTVGQPVFETGLAALAAGGRYVIISSPVERRASFDILDFYHKRLTLLGVDSLAIDAVASARILDRLRAGFEAGALHAPYIGLRLPLVEGKRGYDAVKSGEAGKVVLTTGAFSGG